MVTVQIGSSWEPVPEQTNFKRHWNGLYSFDAKFATRAATEETSTVYQLFEEANLEALLLDWLLQVPNVFTGSNLISP